MENNYGVNSGDVVLVPKEVTVHHVFEDGSFISKEDDGWEPFKVSDILRIIKPAETIEQKAARLEQELEAANQRIAELEQTFNTEVLELVKVNEKLTEYSIGYERLVNEKNDEIKQKNSEIQNLERTRDELLRVISLNEKDYEEIIERKDDQYANLNRQFNALNTNLQETLSENAILNHEIDDFKINQKQLHNEIETLTNTIGERENQLQNAVNEIDRLTSSINQLNESKLQWRKSMDEVSLEIVTLNERLRNTQRELDLAIIENFKSESINSDLSNEIDRYRDALGSMQNDLRLAESDLRNTQGELDAAISEISHWKNLAESRDV